MLLNLAVNLKAEKEEITFSRISLIYKTCLSSLSVVKHLKKCELYKSSDC